MKVCPNSAGSYEITNRLVLPCWCSAIVALATLQGLGLGQNTSAAMLANAQTLPVCILPGAKAPFPASPAPGFIPDVVSLVTGYEIPLVPLASANVVALKGDGAGGACYSEFAPGTYRGAQGEFSITHRDAAGNESILVRESQLGDQRLVSPSESIPGFACGPDSLFYKVWDPVANQHLLFVQDYKGGPAVQALQGETPILNTEGPASIRVSDVMDITAQGRRIVFSVQDGAQGNLVLSSRPEDGLLTQVGNLGRFNGFSEQCATDTESYGMATIGNLAQVALVSNMVRSVFTENVSVTQVTEAHLACNRNLAVVVYRYRVPNGVLLIHNLATGREIGYGVSGTLDAATIGENGAVYVAVANHETSQEEVYELNEYQINRVPVNSVYLRYHQTFLAASGDKLFVASKRDQTPIHREP